MLLNSDTENNIDFIYLLVARTDDPSAKDI